MRKKLLSGLLAAVMILSAPMAAPAAAITAADSARTTSSLAQMGGFVTDIGSGRSATEYSSYEKDLLGQEVYNVSEEDVSKFEKEYARENGLKLAAEETVEDAAKKRAAMLTQLYGLSSVQYALIQDGKITLSGQSGLSSREKKQAPTSETMYGIGSISKMFTTAAIMKLTEEGVLDLDTPVVKYIPEFTMADERYKDITARMLVNHSSGLMGGTISDALMYGDKDTSYHDDFLDSLKTQRLIADPGAYSVYCNDGFTLAEILIEKVSGKSFTQYMKDEVETPLGLNNTKTPQDQFQWSRLAGIFQGNGTKALPADVLSAIGAAGMYSTAEDLCRFSQAFMKQSNGLLSAASVKAMESKEYLRGMWQEEDKNVLAYGLGWDSVDMYPFSQYGIKALVKGGDTLHYHGGLVVLPEENMAVAVLSAEGSSTLNEIFAQSILEDVLKKEGKIQNILENETLDAPAAAPMTEEEKANAGIYGCYTGLYKVDFKNDNLEFSPAIGNSIGVQKFYHASDGKYYSADKSTYLSFVKESNGRNYLWVGVYTTVPGIGQTYTANYQAQRMPENKVSSSVQKAWNARYGKGYFIVSLKYSAQQYTAGSMAIAVSKARELSGYVDYAAIVGKNMAKVDMQIPMAMGRDLMDYQIEAKNGTEYLKMAGITAISEDAIKNLSTKSKSTVKIGSDGFAKWYSVGKKSASKKVKITISNKKKGAFAIYGSNGACQTHSYISGKKTVTLPKGGYIVFAGDKGAKFSVTYKK